MAQEGRLALAVVAAARSLALFVWLLTLHPTDSGRVYAACGGVYVAVALFWLWRVDGVAPTAWNLAGVAVMHPLSATGYLSHFINADELNAKGGAVRFVIDWLAKEAKSRAFIQAEQQRLQGDLFAWADPHGPTRAKQSKLPSPARRSPTRHPR